MRIVPNQTRSMTGDTETEPFPTWFSASSFTHRIAVDILQNGPISRVSLARRFGLTQGAVSRITSDLAHWGVIETAGLLPTSKEGQTEDPRTNQDKTEGDFSETGAARTRLRAGRPQQALVIRHDAKTFIGVNLHGATAMAVAVDLACQPVGMPHQKEIQYRGPGQVTEVLTGLVRDCMAEIRQAGLPEPSGLGISLGGRAAGNRVVTYAPFLQWSEHVDLAAAMEKACGLPCLVFNDLDALALYEGWFGAGIGLDRFVLITIGSGVGYSLAEHGMPVSSSDEGYGLIGHQLVDPDGPTCYLGHRGCAQCLTTGSLVEQYSRKIGRAATVEQFVHDLDQDMPQANTLLNLTGFRLGVLIASVANVAVPEKILIGGETSYLMRRCSESIRKGIDSYRHSQMAEVSLQIIDNDWNRWAQAPAARAIASYLMAPDGADGPQTRYA